MGILGLHHKGFLNCSIWWLHLCPQLNIFGLPYLYTPVGLKNELDFGSTVWVSRLNFPLVLLCRFSTLAGAALPATLHFSGAAPSLYSVQGRGIFRDMKQPQHLLEYLPGLNLNFYIILTDENLRAIRKFLALKWPQIHPWSSNYAFQDTISLSKTQLCH